MDYVTENSLDEYNDATRMWLTSIDLKTNQLPIGSDHPGINFLLAQPTMVAAPELGRRTGCKCYEESVQSYVEDYLLYAFDDNEQAIRLGINEHFNAQTDHFPNRRPTIELHSFAPHWPTIDWIAPTKTELTIHRLSESLTSETRLTETAAILDSLVWFAQQSPSGESLLEQAVNCIQTQYDQHDARFETTAVGVWAESLFRAGDSLDDSRLREMASRALDSWHQQNFIDEHLELTVFSELPRPRRTYAMQTAEACLSAWQQSGDEAWEKCVLKWAEQVERDSKRSRKVCYTEDYGRSIHFLVRAATLMENKELRSLAEQLANDAIDRFFVPKMGMFRSRSNQETCDEADGIGWLLIALLYLDNGRDATSDSPLHF